MKTLIKLGSENQIYFVDEFAQHLMQRIFKRDPLGDLDGESCYNALLYLSIGYKEQPQNLITKVNAMRKELPRFVEQFDKQLAKLIKTYEGVYNYHQAQIEKFENLPEYALAEDTEDTVDFILSLQKDYYTFKDAEQLLDITRQTLKKWADKKMHGIKCEAIQGKKRDYISKESLVKIYRLRHGTKLAA